MAPTFQRAGRFTDSKSQNVSMSFICAEMPFSCFAMNDLGAEMLFESAAMSDLTSEMESLTAAMAVLCGEMPFQCFAMNGLGTAIRFESIAILILHFPTMLIAFSTRRVEIFIAKTMN